MNLRPQVIAALLLCCVSSFSWAKTSEHKVVFVNHFERPLVFKIGINYDDILPDLPNEFNVGVNESKQSTVLKGREAYIRAEDEQNQDNFGFFGLEIKDNKTKIYGYLSHKIAFSWVGDTVTFCTPAEYKEKGSCNRA